MIDKKWVEEYKRKVVLEVQKKRNIRKLLDLGAKNRF